MREVFVAAGQAAWTNIFPAEALAQLSPPLRWFEAIVSPEPTDAVFVVDQEGLVQGFAVVRRSPEPDAPAATGELDSCYTHLSVWGSGAGSLVLRAALEHLRQLGCSEVTCWTAELNHRPRRFYEADGWALDGCRRERELFGVRFAELRYFKRLS